MKMIDSLGNETITDTVTISLELNIPSNLTASQGTSEDGIDVNWGTNGNLEGTIYVLESSDSQDGPWEEIYRGEELTHTDPQGIDVTKYYRVKAVTNKGEETDYSGIVSGTTTCSHVFTAWVNTNSSIHSRTCTKCGEVQTASHTLGSWSTNSSTHSRSCTTCSYRTSGNHSWTSWTITSSATCTSSGSRRRTCTVCARTQTGTISALGHSWGSWSTTSSATCTSGGRQTRRCTRCSQTESRTTSALGHSYGSWEYYSTSSCRRTCSRCGSTITEAHDMVRVEGNRVRSCSKCGYETTY